ncbi:hypothetical protein IWQ62_000278 [Dispira parvispora]|uniref:Uncharacterized protein n=1 Tax=Dispira parvispora TaxID=1520584 RepID=A0A9W8E572_9FUNG|nr:hypothetical protein IWQ62_000278 [Dispira parvispora]
MAESVVPAHLPEEMAGFSKRTQRFVNKLFERCSPTASSVPMTDLTQALSLVEDELGQHIIPPALKGQFLSFAQTAPTAPVTRPELAGLIEALTKPKGGEDQAESDRLVPGATNDAPDRMVGERTPAGSGRVDKFSPFANRIRAEKPMSVVSSKQAAKATMRRLAIPDRLSDNDDDLDNIDNDVGTQKMTMDYRRSSLGLDSLMEGHTSPISPQGGGNSWSASPSQVIEDSMLHKPSMYQTPGPAQHSQMGSPTSSLATTRRLSDTFSPSEINDHRSTNHFFRTVSPPRSLLESLDAESFARQREQTIKAENTAFNEIMLSRHRVQIDQLKKQHERKMHRVLRDHENEIQKMVVRIDEIRSELSTKRREISDLTNKDTKNSMQINSLETEVSRLTKEMSNLHATYTELKKQHELKCTELDELKHNLDIKEQEILDLMENHHEVVDNFDRVMAERKSLEVQVHQLEHRLEATHDLQTELEAIEAEKAMLQVTVDQLQVDLENATQMAQQAQGTAEAVTAVPVASASLTLRGELAASGQLPDTGSSPLADQHHGGSTYTSPSKEGRPDLRSPKTGFPGALEGFPTESEVVAKLVQEKQRFREQLREAMSYYYSIQKDLQDTRESHRRDLERMKAWFTTLYEQLPQLANSSNPDSDETSRAPDLIIDPRSLDMKSFTSAVSQLITTLRQEGQHVQADQLSQDLLQLVVEFSQTNWTNRSIFQPEEEEDTESTTCPVQPTVVHGISLQSFRQGLRQRKLYSRPSLGDSTKSGSNPPEDTATPPTSAEDSAKVLVPRRSNKGFSTCQITTFVLYTLVVYFMGYLTILFTNHMAVEREFRPTAGQPASFQSPIGQTDHSTPNLYESPSAGGHPWLQAATGKDPKMLEIQDNMPPIPSHQRPAHVKRARTTEIFMYWLETLLYNDRTPQVPT